MAERILENFKSRRNHACLVQGPAGRKVVKTFCEEAFFQRELQIYRLLQNKGIPCAEVIAIEGNSLVLSELPGQNLVDWLDRQEQTGRPIWEIWDKLVAWLCTFWHWTGLVMTDVNLRNFLYDETTKTLYGLDFEECREGNIEISAARVAAFVRTYKPENTSLKQEISRYILVLFAQNCGLEVEALFLESKRQETHILQRRKN